MSTEVEQQQPAVAPVIVEGTIVTENGAPAVEPTTAAPNGETKVEEKKIVTVKKEAVPPKDPKTETEGWLSEEKKTVVQKANYYVLDWVIKEVYAEDDAEKPTLPKSGLVTRGAFIGYLKDGVLLARLANKFQPGAAEPVKEGEEAKTKENQEANVKVFESVAKQHVPEEQVFTHADLEKGKESFAKVFTTLFKTMIDSPAELFKVPGGNFEQFKAELDAVSSQKFWQKLLASLNNAGDYISHLVRRPFTRSNSTHTEPTEHNGATTNGVHVNGTTETVAHEENGLTNGTKVEEKKEEIAVTPTVAAN